MATSSNPVNVGKISDLLIDGGKIQPRGTGFKFPDQFPEFMATCGKQFMQMATKASSVQAKLTLLPHTDSKVFPTSLAETDVTFKVVDAAVKAKATAWNFTVPTDAVAYATFSKALLMDDDRDAVLFVTKGKANRLFLKSPIGSHVWQSDPKAVYCRKSQLFVLHADGYSMMVDFGI